TWQVDVVAQIEQARDKLNTFGVAPGARAGMDWADGHEPPPVGDYVSLAFQPPTRDGSLRRDLRGTDASLHTWRAKIQTNVPGMVTLRATGIASVPQDKEVWLVDPALDRAQNLRDIPHYQFPASGDEATRRLRFLVGSSAAVQQALGRTADRPQRVELLPAVPHPVRTHAALRYQVPEPTQVTLELHDLLGRHVATLVDRRRAEPGTRTYNWTPRAGAVSSGTYMLRLRAGDTTRTRRLVVVR
ncbi:MAG: T9SS C-terminal target domain-containing protein, partial [Bacteroidetes bacterium QH_2_63_10]